MIDGVAISKYQFSKILQQQGRGLLSDMMPYGKLYTSDVVLDNIPVTSPQKLSNFIIHTNSIGSNCVRKILSVLIAKSRVHALKSDDTASLVYKLSQQETPPSSIQITIV